jgi:hypothetical protein
MATEKTVNYTEAQTTELVQAYVATPTDETKTLMSKGHQDPAEFMKACEEWYGGPLKGWGKVRHGWGRTVPDRTGEYTFLMLPAKPHARGAYPTTTVVDDPAYDNEDA